MIDDSLNLKFLIEKISQDENVSIVFKDFTDTSVTVKDVLRSFSLGVDTAYCIIDNEDKAIIYCGSDGVSKYYIVDTIPEIFKSDRSEI